MEALAEPPPGACCQPHGAPALGTCLRCGAFICRECRRWQAERPLCVDCRERLGDKVSPQASLALGLATVGLVLLLPGLPALVLGQQELGRIRRCEVSDAGEAHAKFARGLGILELVLTLFGGLYLYLRFA